MSIFIRKVSFPTNIDISSFRNDIVPIKLTVRYGYGHPTLQSVKITSS